MTSDTDSGGVRRVSDAVFFSLLALIVILIVGGGIYLLRPGSSPAKAPPPGLGAGQAPSQTPVTSPGAPPTGATNAGAQAVVEKYFRLTLAGRYAAACALESPAYRRFDAQHYSHGSCEAESRADARTLSAQGVSMQLTSTTVTSYAGDRATVLAEVTIGSRVVSERIYVRYLRGTWWLTGGDDSGGDLGF